MEAAGHCGHALRKASGRATRPVLYGVLTHPAELAAAAVWFGLVTWLMARTKSMGDCVIAHAVTNAALGIYVLTSGDWQLM